MPLISRILFALSILALIITAVVQVINWLKYKKEMKAYQSVLARKEKEAVRQRRIAKEAEVIRKYHETQAHAVIEVHDVPPERQR
jgi:Na+-transporting methylmalonyl-CoA/oxaloacetate decarboxylase gamma subunit